jgi:hypothetical protein
MKCKHCGSEKTRKNGTSEGHQRYKCNACKRTFSGTPAKHSENTKRMAVWMSLNGIGIRKIAMLLGTNHVNILNWVKKAHKTMVCSLEKSNADYSEEIDIIEMDEIYTFVQKKGGSTRYGLLILDGQSVLLRL